MIKKQVIILLSIFTLSLLLTPVNAAIKAGGSCSKVGTKSVLLSKTYTCIKSGKKLVWDKGVDKSSAVAPLTISIDNLDLKGVPQKAYEIVIKELNSRQPTIYKPTIIAGANVKQSRVDQEIGGLSKAIELWSPYFQPDKFQIVYVARGDEKWLDNKTVELGLGSLIPPGETWEDRMKISPCGFAMAGTANGIPTFVQCLNADYLGGYRQTGPHEYTHLFQQSYGGSNMFNIPWYTEGSASFFGWSLGFHPYQPNSYVRSHWLLSLYSNMDRETISDFSSRDIAKFKSRMRLLKPSPEQSIANASYWAGALATEVLVGLYGFDKFVEFTKKIQTGQDISTLLTQTYGFSEDFFYEKLAPYVWAHIPS